jgi:O-glycosyl hydrolase
MMEKCIPGHRGAGVCLCLPHINTILITVLPLCLLFSQAAIAATGTVNYNTVYQELEGFGAAAVYDPTYLASHSQKKTLYDLMFRDLGLEFIRIPNCVGYDNTSVTETIIAAARQPGRSPGIKIEMVPWSPPASCSSGA